MTKKLGKIEKRIFSVWSEQKEYRVNGGFANGSDRKAQEARMSSYKIMQNNNNMKPCTPLNTYEFLYHISVLSYVIQQGFGGRKKMRH